MRKSKVLNAGTNVLEIFDSSNTGFVMDLVIYQPNGENITTVVFHGSWSDVETELAEEMVKVIGDISNVSWSLEINEFTGNVEFIILCLDDGWFAKYNVRTL